MCIIIYPGQEAGLNKSLAFFEKDEINWSSFPYEEIIRALSAIKTTNPALYNGSFGGKLTYIEEENDHIIAFQRTKDNNTVTVIINMSNQDQELTADITELLDNRILLHGVGDEAHSKEEINITNDNLKNITQLSPWEYYVIAN